MDDNIDDDCDGVTDDGAEASCDLEQALARANAATLAKSRFLAAIRF